MAKFRMKRKMDVNQVVKRIVRVVLSLYVGGTILIQLGSVMNGTTSPFYKGLELIGWTVSTTGQITATSGTGILTVIGIIAIASVVLDFVDMSW